MKQMYVFAGPNGSGKSTIVNEAIALGQCPAKFISPDNYVSIADRDNVAAFRLAQTQADTYRQALVAGGESFSFETVLSIPAKLDFIEYAKHRGWWLQKYMKTIALVQIRLNGWKDI